MRHASALPGAQRRQRGRPRSGTQRYNTHARRRPALQTTRGKNQAGRARAALRLFRCGKKSPSLRGLCPPAGGRRSSTRNPKSVPCNPRHVPLPSSGFPLSHRSQHRLPQRTPPPHPASHQHVSFRRQCGTCIALGRPHSLSRRRHAAACSPSAAQPPPRRRHVAPPHRPGNRARAGRFLLGGDQQPAHAATMMKTPPLTQARRPARAAAPGARGGAGGCSVACATRWRSARTRLGSNKGQARLAQRRHCSAARSRAVRAQAHRTPAP